MNDDPAGDDLTTPDHLARLSARFRRARWVTMAGTAAVSLAIAGVWIEQGGVSPQDTEEKCMSQEQDDAVEREQDAMALAVAAIEEGNVDAFNRAEVEAFADPVVLECDPEDEP